MGNIIRYFEIYIFRNYPQTYTKMFQVILFLIAIDAIFLLFQFSINSIILNENVFVSNLVGGIPEIVRNFVYNIYPFLFTISFSLFIEEVVFRLPLAFFIRKYNDTLKVVTFIVISSLLFSFFHFQYFSIYEVIMVMPSIFLAGVIYSCVFLIAGANKGKVVFPLFVVTCVHILWDLLAFSLVGMG